MTGPKDSPTAPAALPENRTDETPTEGVLDDDAKLDIALEDSFPASEPPQLTEPKTAADKEASEAAHRK